MGSPPSLVLCSVELCIQCTAGVRDFASHDVVHCFFIRHISLDWMVLDRMKILCARWLLRPQGSSEFRHSCQFLRSRWIVRLLLLPSLKKRLFLPPGRECECMEVSAGRSRMLSPRPGQTKLRSWASSCLTGLVLASSEASVYSFHGQSVREERPGLGHCLSDWLLEDGKHALSHLVSCCSFRNYRRSRRHGV